MNVAIVGSRGYAQPQLVEWWVRSLASRDPDARVLSGGARGVDAAAERAAAACGLAWQSYRPHELAEHEWTVSIIVDGVKVAEVGRFRSFVEAAKDRNVWLVEFSDKVVAFWDGESRGTAHAMSVARGLRSLYVYGPDGRLDASLGLELASATGVGAHA